MSILPQLEKNKGTLSSALGKALAQKALAGDKAILEEAVALLAHESKNVRSGAAKIVEQVAERRPEWVAPHGRDLLRALDVPEPQTRWMAIHTLGLCSALDPRSASAALPKARDFLGDPGGGICLWDRSVTYLGYFGATSQANARKVIPLIEQALADFPSLERRVLDSLGDCVAAASRADRDRVAAVAEACARSKKASVQASARKLQKRIASL